MQEMVSADQKELQARASELYSQLLSLARIDECMKRCEKEVADHSRQAVQIPTLPNGAYILNNKRELVKYWDDHRKWREAHDGLVLAESMVKDSLASKVAQLIEKGVPRGVWMPFGTGERIVAVGILPNTARAVVMDYHSSGNGLPRLDELERELLAKKDE